jgi:hypothetical protein
MLQIVWSSTVGRVELVSPEAWRCYTAGTGTVCTAHCSPIRLRIGNRHELSESRKYRNPDELTHRCLLRSAGIVRQMNQLGERRRTSRMGEKHPPRTPDRLHRGDDDSVGIYSECFSRAFRRGYWPRVPDNPSRFRNYHRTFTGMASRGSRRWTGWHCGSLFMSDRWVSS